eukprot:1160871-Pelagomonas_calceolata.AAC.10
MERAISMLYTAIGTVHFAGADIDAIVKRLQVWGVSMLFVIGGDGGENIANFGPLQTSCNK